jgi:hypothetical protein
MFRSRVGYRRLSRGPIRSAWILRAESPYESVGGRLTNRPPSSAGSVDQSVCNNVTREFGIIAIQETLDAKAVDWMEHVTDEQYRLSS